MSYCGLNFVLDDKAVEQIRATVGQILIEQNKTTNPIGAVRVAGRITDQIEAFLITSGIATLGE